jgi:hypothetical protein
MIVKTLFGLAGLILVLAAVVASRPSDYLPHGPEVAESLARSRS